jgi:hypothetical protein
MLKALVAVFLVSGLALERVSGSSPAHAQMQDQTAVSIAGLWKIDRTRLPKDQDIWRRRVDALAVGAPDLIAQAAAQNANPLMTAPVGSLTGLEIAELRASMRDLLETAESLSFDVKPSAVTITDDLNRVREYATTGKKEQRQFSATVFDVKTRWTGAALAQELSAHGFNLTEVYLVKSEGHELLVSLTITKPKFTPPVATIQRVYVRPKAAQF